MTTSNRHREILDAVISLEVAGALMPVSAGPGSSSIRQDRKNADRQRVQDFVFGFTDELGVPSNRVAEQLLTWVQYLHDEAAATFEHNELPDLWSPWRAGTATDVLNNAWRMVEIMCPLCSGSRRANRTVVARIIDPDEPTIVRNSQVVDGVLHTTLADLEAAGRTPGLECERGHEIAVPLDACRTAIAAHHSSGGTLQRIVAHGTPVQDFPVSSAITGAVRLMIDHSDRNER